LHQLIFLNNSQWGHCRNWRQVTGPTVELHCCHASVASQSVNLFGSGLNYSQWGRRKNWSQVARPTVEAYCCHTSVASNECRPWSDGNDKSSTSSRSRPGAHRLNSSRASSRLWSVSTTFNRCTSAGVLLAIMIKHVSSSGSRTPDNVPTNTPSFNVKTSMYLITAFYHSLIHTQVTD